MKIINLTPHSINFVWEPVNPNGTGSGFYEELASIPASGKLARVSAKTVVTGEINGIPVTSTVYGEVEGLPEPADDTIYVVSQLVASRVPDRQDVFIPNESVRDAHGRIIGCKSLGHI